MATHRPTGPGPARPGETQGSGIYVNVGANTGVFAAGDQARAAQVNWGTSDADVLARLEEALQRLTTAAAAELGEAQAEQVSDDAERVAEEARRKRPDRDRITQLLGRITARVGSVAVLLEAVDRVKDLIQALPH